MSWITHSKPWIEDADFLALGDVLRSRMLAQGEVTTEFEYSLSSWVGAKDGVAVGSGAAALVLALTALEVEEGDEVVLPTYVCESVLEAVLTSGAMPVLCDVGNHWVVTPENMAGCITSRTKALIVPHMYGVFADVKSFQKFGVPIIEDCAQAIDYRGRQEIFGAIAIFSFQPTKCLTTGEGGMAVSNNSDLVNAMRSTRDGQKMAKRGRFFSPLSNISAALGLAQLKRYHQALDRRKVLALGYKHALAKVIPDSLQASALDKSIYLRFPIKISGGVDSYQDLFAKKNICVRRGVDRLLHRLSNLSDDNFQTAVTLYNTTVSLPIYPALTDKEHAYCVESAVEIFAARHS